MKKKVALEIISYVFIFLFVYTAASKCISYSTFVSNIEHSKVIAQFAVPLSILVPAAELVVAALLLFSQTRRIGMWGALVLMSTFTIYVAAILSFAEELPCSCGGIISELSWSQHLILNIVFMGLAMWGVYILSNKRDMNPTTSATIAT